MISPVEPEPNPELSEALARKVRRLMLIAGLTTALGLGAVSVAIGYRLFRGEGSRAPANVVAMLPKGAKVGPVSVAGDRIVVTVDVGGRLEIHTFDAHSLRPAGKLSFASEP